MKRYFYVTIHFSPDYEEEVLTKCQDGLYINTKTGETFGKRLLYDFGWGQEMGFELLPQLPFDELIKLIEQPIVFPKRRLFKKPDREQIQEFDIWRSNLYGAAAVIMQDYAKELVEFLSVKIRTDYFSNSHIRENFKCFSFDSQKTMAEGKIPGGVLTKSYEDILNEYPLWHEISSEVVKQVYL